MGTRFFAEFDPDRERHPYRQVTLQDGLRLMFTKMIQNAQADLIYGEPPQATAAAEFLEDMRLFFADRPGVVGCGRHKRERVEA